MKKYNFNAGPAILPREVIDGTMYAVNGYDGLSLMEISHRSKEFGGILKDTVSLFRELLDVPYGYSVIFLGGGASLQFCMVPYNLLETRAAYLNTGSWAKKAMKEAKFFGDVVEVASSEDSDYTFIPKDYAIPTDVDYFHVTTNNTIFGTELFTDIYSPVPLVADMSSDIFSRPVDVGKYGLIYGGVQKNLGTAGLAFVVVRDDILGKVSRSIPTMLDYGTHIKAGSLYNTPPVVPIYSVFKNLEWIKSVGGVGEINARNRRKAALLYDAIDASRIFRGTASVGDRSLMNVCFVMKDEYKELEGRFADYVSARGVVGIKGHRSVGGFRASLYNALPEEYVGVLVSLMKESEREVA
ncbi:MAG: 3-phosphoserine/phosphohydroxythreonine transaminase [Dysgonamonadaceae bacterium]|jgi:phosphoserine aminotransferase|nr:3-phosphoserine/phosphohydroxythreonine transaminase [Dysgonamonadaceae bacterium]